MAFYDQIGVTARCRTPIPREQIGNLSQVEKPSQSLLVAPILLQQTNSEICTPMTTADFRTPYAAPPIHPNQLLVTRPDAAVLLGVKETKFKHLVRDGLVEVIHLGRRQMVTVASLRRIAGQTEAG